MSGMIGQATDFVWKSASWVDGSLRSIPYANNYYTHVYEKFGTPAYQFVVPKLTSFYSYTIPVIKEHYYISSGVGVVISFFLIRAWMSPEENK